ncbi:hypothetical protein N7492_002180 [Penicillium capsulatum]|uniref:Uncharacterized protein n=1 Tax=Penicillium capsulatum TaxID=69766 RepID=A0A9W9II40_9EURO|nr:hypothetical protein N7492_002180 [Penicillium capsulatum]KAJ6123210.1 hypothetical protein N7512_005675 [Penicillium capsulatum]
MSFYVASNQMIEHGKPFGQHRRATVFNGKPRYDEIISEEASGRKIKRLTNTHETRGEVLVMGRSSTLSRKIDAYCLVSASHDVRDLSRKIVRRHLEQRVSVWMMVAFIEDLDFFHEADEFDTSENDPVDWDTWLIPEALHDANNPGASQCSLISLKYCTERRNLLKGAPLLRSKQPEMSLLSDGRLQATRSTDSEKESIATDPRTRDPGVYFPTNFEDTVNPLLLIKEKEQVKSPKPSGALGRTNHNHGVFTSPDSNFREPRGKGAFHIFIPDSTWAQADEHIDSIQTLCKAVTGQTLSQKQAREIKDCGDELVTNIQSNHSIASLKSLLVNCQLHALPNFGSHDLKTSLTACVAYLSYLSSIDFSASKAKNLNRRLAQIWIHIHFENHINDLKESEENGFPLNRQGRTISTIARDSVLMAFHGCPFVPQKASRDFLSDQCRWGERWWKVATCMGLGVVLLASEALANQMYIHPALWYYGMINLLILIRGRRTAFQNKMVDTFAIYVLNCYPALIRLYQSFESVVVGLMLGGENVFSHDRLCVFLDALVEDETYISCKVERWLIPNPKSLSKFAASHLIFIQRHQAVDSPGGF